MPLNTLRLNAPPSSHPNHLITFIKPLPRPPHLQSTYTTADTFLRAIAAQCLPLMTAHHLSLTTLEEHEPNREFIGRNFNNGEIIQLVLQSKSGSWLPYEMVQMVMMHELAHNTHMNHGKGFWEVRNLYAGEMRALWGRGYTGEGFWGMGRRLSDMRSVMGENVVGSEELKGLPVCGGTYRSRMKKRRKVIKDELTWKEKRDRRIEKKFGGNGVSLGEDEDQRMLLELGKKGHIGGKPRVARSKRGRELRAAAALARFDTNKKEADALTKGEDIKDEEGASESDDYEDVEANLEDAKDTNGQRLLDSNGNTMVRVCGEEERDTKTNDAHIKQEIDELLGLEKYCPRISQQNPKLGPGDACTSSTAPLNTETLNPLQSRTSNAHKANTPPSPHLSPSNSNSIPNSPHPAATLPHTTFPPTTPNLQLPPPTPPSESPTQTTCPICSLSNPSPSTTTHPPRSLTLTCLACSHVLHPSRDKHSWSCPSESCKSLGLASGRPGYVNAGDVGRCGICGVRKPGGVRASNLVYL